MAVVCLCCVESANAASQTVKPGLCHSHTSSSQAVDLFPQRCIDPEALFEPHPINLESPPEPTVLLMLILSHVHIFVPSSPRTPGQAPWLRSRLRFPRKSVGIPTVQPVATAPLPCTSLCGASTVPYSAPLPS